MDPGNLFPIDKEYCLDCGTEVADEGTNQYPAYCPACWARRQAQQGAKTMKTMRELDQTLRDLLTGDPQWNHIVDGIRWAINSARVGYPVVPALQAMSSDELGMLAGDVYRACATMADVPRYLVDRFCPGTLGTNSPADMGDYTPYDGPDWNND